MTTSIEISVQTFFSARDKPAAFQNLLALCLSAKRTLSFRIASETVHIEVESDNAAGVQIFGRWCSPSLCNAPQDHSSVKLLLPLFFNAWRVRLPHDQIYTMGHTYRSIGDFFARNVFVASIRGADVSFKNVGSDNASVAQIREFRRNYFYLVKAEFPEPVFRDQNAGDVLNLLLLETYLPIMEFNHPLLRRGAHVLRKAVGSDTETVRTTMKSQLMAARKAFLSIR